ncbi:hypothetical protein [Desulfoluna sp.]|uniref:hypothetical protein n=1 Tax=Desulfoluna sp. TaxID=2045199 RepID=UPI0026192D71|nr:hypothetical protein [Desulfoluna sp.]
MKKCTLLLSLLLLCATSLHAQTFSGQGFGPSREEAKKEALADLSQNLHVEVVSEFSSVTTQTGTTADTLKTKHLDVSSRLPLLGVELSVDPAGADFKAIARLSDTTRPLYEKERSTVHQAMNQTLSKTDKAPTNTEKTALLQEALTQIDRFERLSLVARLLGMPPQPPLDVTDAEVKARIRQLEKKADTLDAGLKLMARGISKKGIYIFPPTAGASREITQFASAVKDHLSIYVNTSPSLSSAAYIMTGEYTLLDNAIELTYRLIDQQQNTLQTSMSLFLPSAYKGYQIKPATLDFEKLIASGMVISNDFSIDIKTANGRSDLLYKGGDTITLLIKMNQPGYFYLMSHTFKDDAYTYLVELSNSPGNRRFVSYVGPDEAGKWVELGEFEAVPPYGVETLQVFAATEDLEDRVPYTFRDPTTELYKVGTPLKEKTRPAEAVVTTRGLMLKKKKTALHAEASLTVTTMTK